eukprot:1579053-Prorocentrum_lima.AAC.1
MLLTFDRGHENVFHGAQLPAKVGQPLLLLDLVDAGEGVGAVGRHDAESEGCQAEARRQLLDDDGGVAAILEEG